MKTVACPACSELCSLLPLRRGGNFRLMDAGGSHAPVCPDLVRRFVGIAQYANSTHVNTVSCRKTEAA